jgi:predicted DNA-binding transcriptional regulator AlpA
MSPRRQFYTREQICAFCGVSERQVFRWEEQGRLTKLPDPTDPSGRRVRFDGRQVESWERQRQRRAKNPPKRRRPAMKKARAASAPHTVPRPHPNPHAEAPNRDFAPGGRAMTSPRDKADEEMDRWIREIDERKRRWEAEHPEESEPVPPPKRF